MTCFWGKFLVLSLPQPPELLPNSMLYFCLQCIQFRGGIQILNLLGKVGFFGSGISIVSGKFTDRPTSAAGASASTAGAASPPSSAGGAASSSDAGASASSSAGASPSSSPSSCPCSQGWKKPPVGFCFFLFFFGFFGFFVVFFGFSFIYLPRRKSF
jgi:hypothetical protein